MSAPDPQARTRTVLVVDDEMVSLTMLQYFLEKAGHRVLPAPTAAQAREIVAGRGAACLDCVVTDYQLPGESGLDLLLWLKRQDPALPVIVITGTKERATADRALESGASDCLEKPIDPVRLRRAVEVSLLARPQ